ncbi:DUF6894 family protein [Bosea sp. NBC_00550]|uniref:DUF6894 family protein n=1 Tax=Bosea sp. NBC_00550 TaxID=2969621 RepID=UPI003FA47FA0
MPQYFFHTQDGVKIDIDDEGTDLPNDAAAMLKISGRSPYFIACCDRKYFASNFERPTRH